MKIPLLASVLAGLFLALVLLADDYVELRQQVSYVKADEKANRALEGQKDGHKQAKGALGANDKGRADTGENKKEPPETYVLFGKSLKITDSFVAAFTFALLIVAILQWRLFKTEFYTTHRPKLVVRRVKFLDDSEVPPGKKLGVHFVITNVGDADGTIESSDVTVQAFAFTGDGSSPLPPVPPYNFPDINNFVSHTKIKVGDTARFVVFSDAISERPSVAMRQKNYGIMLLGWMVYRNDGGRSGYTAFCRVYSAKHGTFVQPKEHDETPKYDRYDYIG